MKLAREHDSSVGQVSRYVLSTYGTMVERPPQARRQSRPSGKFNGKFQKFTRRPRICRGDSGVAEARQVKPRPDPLPRIRPGPPCRPWPEVTRHPRESRVTAAELRLLDDHRQQLGASCTCILAMANYPRYWPALMRLLLRMRPPT